MNEIYEETFEDSRVLNNEESIKFVIDRIYESYPPEKGWEVEKPTITPNYDGPNGVSITVTITAKLKCDKRNKQTSIFDTLPRR